MWTAFAAHASSCFPAIVSRIYYTCGLLIAPRVTWVTLFASNKGKESDEHVTVVVRTEATFGFNQRVQGHVMFQQYGTQSNLFRLVVDGYLPPDADSEGGKGNDKPVSGDTEGTKKDIGKRVIGALYFPDGVLWCLTHKKVKSNNDTSIRGRCTLISFTGNISGMRSIQVSFIHNSITGKAISASFQSTVDYAVMVSNKVRHNGNQFVIQ
jgi:hypothetical protein